ncbi:hypothetical protein [Streptomyces qinzhouensis]|uniref:Uncharacterized protein n=1 Tax=Streptomyces qinzhouensis TaxID=2599401 RepID=A0A5B8JA91_9ACTN|nr:hypothetical protein [Streptomyces qinzhouensis]QDY77354.1 hypothetical protein FQU76_13410 [Streptomyces qinzhouensis]
MPRNPFPELPGTRPSLFTVGFAFAASQISVLTVLAVFTAPWRWQGDEYEPFSIVTGLFAIPFVSFFFGALQTLLHTVPVMALADLAVARRGGAPWKWLTGITLGSGALYAAPVLFLSPFWFPAAWAAVAVLAVVPLATVSYVDRRARTHEEPVTSGAVWFWAYAGGAFASCLVVIAVFGFGT